jgi:lipoprotein-releasing system permease protein
MGATNWRIRKVFVVYSLLIVVRGMLIGNLLGFGFVGLQWWLGLVKLDPEAYYVSVAPVSFDIGWIIGINVVTFVVTILSLILPSALISRIETAKVIQFD